MSDIRQWKIVAFLVRHGFRYYHQYDPDGLLVPYPTTMRDAKDFVARYNGSS